MSVVTTSRSLIRTALSATVYPEGSVRRILRGPCRGLRYRIFPEFGLSPVYGGWEPDAQRLMVDNLKPESVAYDLGANYGIHTLLMARCVSGSGHVYAFEPAPGICAELKRNVTLNGFSHVSVLQLAASGETSQCPFVFGAHGGAGHLASPMDSQIDAHIVDTVTLDHFVYSQGHRPPAFMKIDVEGAESQVLAGAGRVLREARPTILVELHSPSEDVAVGQILLDHRYTAYRIAKAGNMTRVANLNEGWPSPVGLWGQIIAFPSSGSTSQSNTTNSQRQ